MPENELKNTELISIIIPVYNAADYLQRSISSVLNQTYPFWELLMVDDGSSDDSIQICSDYAKKDSRIKLICNEHGGTAKARNTALDVAKGEYIVFLDADDAYHPQYLQSMYLAVKESGSDIALCTMERGDDASAFLAEQKEPVFLKESVDEALCKMYRGSWLKMIVPWTKLYSRKIFDTIRFPDGMFFEDAATMNLAIYYANAVVETEEPLYFYNITPNSSSVTKRSVELLDREKALRSHWEFYLVENRMDLVYLCMPFYLVELISIYHRIEQSDKPTDCEIIRERFERSYRQYHKKIDLNEYQKKQILAFRHPTRYDIQLMIKENGFWGTLDGFIKRKLRKFF